MIIPFNIASGTYTLKLFNEHINGDFKTDYASAFADVTLSVNSAIGKNGEDGLTPYVGGERQLVDRRDGHRCQSGGGDLYGDGDRPGGGGSRAGRQRGAGGLYPEPTEEERRISA